MKITVMKYTKNRGKSFYFTAFYVSLPSVLCLLNLYLSIWHPFITRPTVLTMFSISYILDALASVAWLMGEVAPGLANSQRQQRASLDTCLSYVN